MKREESETDDNWATKGTLNIATRNAKRELSIEVIRKL